MGVDEVSEVSLSIRIQDLISSWGVKRKFGIGPDLAFPLGPSQAVSLYISMFAHWCHLNSSASQVFLLFVCTSGYASYCRTIDIISRFPSHQTWFLVFVLILLRFDLV